MIVNISKLMEQEVDFYFERGGWIKELKGIDDSKEGVRLIKIDKEEVHYYDGYFVGNDWALQLLPLEKRVIEEKRLSFKKIMILRNTPMNS
ncbi:hypothetical protein [Heyndrickxia oleronia]|jgi:hypothetical protein|uniref:hypothetical protein n=1 Tax=Heyndrickxia oleronia TaxID=38875 RepID=UPI00242F3D72|nr:hypothetical protein [Heyndrickxia oleronia]MCI1589792.1 hypothetical protein [Heyndrickxia oleronia]MCI1613500.1 hypothetical protein [Heyndrickxia oleronia]MCI1744385.1 hypothetical protein [Heyndrickxia oleronia]MCI1763052.1 hypothetical protein [Heyndrickxia oleronia]